MTIRGATVEDAEALLGIYAGYVEHTAISFEYSPPTVEAFRERIARTLQRYPWLVAEEKGEILGYAYAGPFKGRPAYDWSCEVSIYVRGDCHGRGVGRALYAALEAALGDMGVTNLYACIAVPRVPDEYLTLDSPRFHARMGYTEVGRFHECGYKFGRWYDMMWMEKVIGAHEADQPPVRWRVESGINSEWKMENGK